MHGLRATLYGMLKFPQEQIVASESRAGFFFGMKMEWKNMFTHPLSLCATFSS